MNSTMLDIDVDSPSTAFESEYRNWQQIETEKEAQRAQEQKEAQWDRSRPKRSYRPTGRSDVLDLVNALGRAEWGPIAAPKWRGHRAILSTLASLMYDAHRGYSAKLVTTAVQIADRAGYSERWTRICLSEMEEIGLISWVRGGVVDGRVTPSVITVLKKTLCDWIRDARERHIANAKERLQKTRLRLAQIRNDTLPPSMVLKLKMRKQRRLAVEAELRHIQRNEALLKSIKDHPVVTTSPRPYGGKSQGNAPENAHAEKIIPLKERKEIKEEMLTDRVAQYLPERCTHGRGRPEDCSTCEMIALTKSQGETRRILKERSQETRGKEFTSYMHANYPDARPSQWPRICLRDPEARRLAKEQDFNS